MPSEYVEQINTEHTNLSTIESRKYKEATLVENKRTSSQYTNRLLTIQMHIYFIRILTVGCHISVQVTKNSANDVL